VNLLTAVTELISIFLFTTCFLFVARKAAKRIGLVDKPNFRKRHQGLIPLVGGISVYAGICFTFSIADYYIPHAALYLACAVVFTRGGNRSADLAFLEFTASLLVAVGRQKHDATAR
jgi:UDP-GlcNAc:undecaprenyl-phosphate GlcNAc-1-phosphate transferase